ncbi:MAG: metalloregulator ArsR/SmtB family transcription factor [Thermodesulfobacteriota bacterium]
MELNQADLFRVLGVETRIRIIELLKQKGPMGVNDLSNALGVTPSAVSQHLKILKHAGLVRSERKGYWIPYEVNPRALERCQQLISQVCTCGCKGTGDIREAELERAEDRLALLKKWANELQTELDAIRHQIQELEREG